MALLEKMPTTSSDAARVNREHWVSFVKDEIDRPLQLYDAAATLVQKQDALKSIQAAWKTLDARNRETPWGPSVALQSALDELFRRPNVAIRIDLATLGYFFENNLITTGPVERKGYIAMVTAGPKTGFGLIPSDDAIVFYNRQRYSSATNVWDFQRQLLSDPKGSRVAKLYQFQVTSFDQAELTIVAALSTSGLSITPSYTHDVNARVDSCPTAKPGAGTVRLVGALVGFDQERINEEVRQNAIPKMRQRIEEEAMEQGLENTSQQAAIQNEKFARYLIGNHRVASGQLLVDRVTTKTRPDSAHIGGMLGYQGSLDNFGADASRPSSFERSEPGISAELHLTSILDNLARGYLASDSVKSVKNLMVVTQLRPAEAPISEGFKLTRNVNDATFFKAVETAREAADPKILALRVRRPEQPPQFAVAPTGRLVAIINDVELELPYSAKAGQGGGLLGIPPAKVLRIVAPRAEITLALVVEPATASQPIHLAGRIEGFEPGPGLKVYALNDATTKPAALNAFTSNLVVGFFRQRILGQTVNAPTSTLPLQGFALGSVSPLDPSGWIRVNLVKAPEVSLAAKR